MTSSGHRQDRFILEIKVVSSNDRWRSMDECNVWADRLHKFQSILSLCYLHNFAYVWRGFQ